MIINSITANTVHRGRLISPDIIKRERECVKERDNHKQNNYDNINTSIKSNPDARVSFKGAPLLHKAANFAYKNPIVADACFTLPIVCALRPGVILATAKNKEEKTKCEYQAAKSVTSGLAGLMMTAIVGTPIAAAVFASKGKGTFKIPPEIEAQSKEVIEKGINTLKDIAEKNKTSEPKLSAQISKFTKGEGLNLGIFDKDGENTLSRFQDKIKKLAEDEYTIVKEAIEEQKSLNNYEDTAKNVSDKFFQPIFMPLRAAITIATIPITLKFLGFKKPSVSKEEIQRNMFNTLNSDVFVDETSKVLFQPFSGVAKYENK